MAQTLEVNVESRNETGKGAAGRLRRQGKVPCVVYGHGLETHLLTVSAEELDTVVHAHGMITLNEAGQDSRSVLVRDVQLDHVHGDVLHVDFQVVRLDEKISNTIPLVVTGEAAGLTHGGVVEQLVHDIEVECYPQHLPESIEVDISALDIGDSISVGQIPMPENVVCIASDPDAPAFTCEIPRVEEEEEAAGDEEAITEPEVIEKGKKEEEEED